MQREVIRRWLPKEEGFAQNHGRGNELQYVRGRKETYVRFFFWKHSVCLEEKETACGAFYGRYRDDPHAFTDP